MSQAHAVATGTGTVVESPIKRLTKDLKQASLTLSKKEARYLVDSYYQMQESRKRAGNQVRALTESDEPHSVIQWFGEQADAMEGQVARALKAYAEAQPIGRWAMSIVGIGPIITAGLLAHIDVEVAKTAGDVWRFAGLDPTSVWGKGQKRPWNASLKALCYKIGDSFIKFQNHKDDHYGQLYRIRRAYEEAKNEAGDYAEQAARILATKNIGKDTEAYKAYIQGKLPPAHLLSRARRWTVKLFLSHFFEVAYQLHHNEAPPKPYAISILDHAHYHPVPNSPF